MTDRIVVFFAYHFPPENVIGAARPFRFYKYLRRAGYRVHVVTAAHPGMSDQDDITYIHDAFETESPRGLSWQVERAFRKVMLPAAVGTRWAIHASRSAAEFIGRHPHARITLLSSFPPVGSHLAAMRLQRSHRLRWVADFRDPAYYSALLQVLNPLQSRVVLGLERTMLHHADIALTTTNRVASLWARHHPDLQTPVHTIWNGYDPDERIFPMALPSRHYRLISHVGNLYSGRTVVPVVESLVRLVDSGRLAAHDLRIRLVGEIAPGSLATPETLSRATAQGWLDVDAGTVPKHEAIRLARESDGLLLVQPHSSDLVPGKLYEYLQTGRPILAYVPRDSVIEEILSRSGAQYVCVYADASPAEMEASLLQYFAMRFETRPPNEWFEHEFDGRRQAEQVASLIESLYAPAAAEPVAVTGSQASS